MSKLIKILVVVGAMMALTSCTELYVKWDQKQLV